MKENFMNNWQRSETTKQFKRSFKEFRKRGSRSEGKTIYFHIF